MFEVGDVVAFKIARDIQAVVLDRSQTTRTVEYKVAYFLEGGERRCEWFSAKELCSGST